MTPPTRFTAEDFRKAIECAPRGPQAYDVMGEIWEIDFQAMLRQGAADAKRVEELERLVREATEIMNITYAGNFPAGIESFLVRAGKALVVRVSERLPVPR